MNNISFLFKQKSLILENILIFICLLFFNSCESSLVNPDTPGPLVRIQYSIPVESYIKLIFENSYKKAVKTLVDSRQTAGNYFCEFDTSDLPEGIYFYVLTARGVNDNYYKRISKHLILIK